MKGSPLRQLIAVLTLFAALLIPLLALSGREAPPPPPIEHGHAHADEDSRVTTWATLHFAHPPLHVHLHQGSRDLWHLDPSTETEFETELELGIADGFAEIVAHVVWPEGTPETVVELTLEPDGLDEKTASSWGSTKLDTIFAFKW